MLLSKARNFFVSTLVNKSLKNTDFDRWSTSDSLAGWWNGRTARMAELIPNNSRVLEMGAGSQYLGECLDPSCVYYPSDIVSRDERTIIVDLNQKDLPDLKLLKPDVIVFSGVLEYVYDITHTVNWLVNHDIKICIASYQCIQYSPANPIAIYRELQRSSKGWVNSYSREKFVNFFLKQGFVLTAEESWLKQTIFTFRLHSL